MHSAGVKIKNRPTPSPRQLSSPAPPPIGGGGDTDDEDGSGLPPLVTFETLSREVEGLRRERIDSIYQVLTQKVRSSQKIEMRESIYRIEVLIIQICC